MAKLRRETIWQYIKGLGRNVTSADLQQEFSLSRYGARAHLVTLRRMGALKRNGRTCNSEYVVIRPDMDVGDRRGTNPNSLLNLRYVMRAKATTRARTDKPNKHWAAATELDKCWGMGSVSLDAHNAVLSNSPREGAPSESDGSSPDMPATVRAFSFGAANG